MIEDTKELFNEDGCIPVWGHQSATGKPYYTFQLTEKDKYILFPYTGNNPKSPRFQLKKTNPAKKPEG